MITRSIRVGYFRFWILTWSSPNGITGWQDMNNRIDNRLEMKKDRLTGYQCPEWYPGRNEITVWYLISNRIDNRVRIDNRPALVPAPVCVQMVNFGREAARLHCLKEGASLVGEFTYGIETLESWILQRNECAIERDRDIDFAFWERPALSYWWRHRGREREGEVLVSGDRMEAQESCKSFRRIRFSRSLGWRIHRVLRVWGHAFHCNCLRMTGVATCLFGTLRRSCFISWMFNTLIPRGVAILPTLLLFFPRRISRFAVGNL